MCCWINSNNSRCWTSWSLPRLGLPFKIKLDVLLDTYEYSDAQGNRILGQIARLSENRWKGGIWWDCCYPGSRIPAIWVKQFLNGTNNLQVAFAIGLTSGPHPIPSGNYIINFFGNDTPSTGEWFTLIITQFHNPSSVSWYSQIRFLHSICNFNVELAGKLDI